MYHYIYKTTNLLNGAYYIGAHSAKALINDYFGSGKILNYNIKKYGLENFSKQILYILNSRKEKFIKEAELVNEELLKDPLCMNLAIGGQGSGKENL
jgi:hypothetical protein